MTVDSVKVGIVYCDPPPCPRCVRGPCRGRAAGAASAGPDPGPAALLRAVRVIMDIVRGVIVLLSFNIGIHIMMTKYRVSGNS